LGEIIVANTKQSLKRVRQAEKHRVNNQWQKTRMSTYIKRVLVAIEAKDHTLAMREYSAMTSIIDRLSAKGIIHKNKAARHKSRINNKIKALVVKEAV
jgi:small subunit ribosomal protein S20